LLISAHRAAKTGENLPLTTSSERDAARSISGAQSEG
jgi:hypothetical protein